MANAVTKAFTALPLNPLQCSVSGGASREVQPNCSVVILDIFCALSMKTLTGSLLAGILGTSMPAPVSARPLIYTSATSYIGNTEMCLANAKEILVKQGFTRELETSYYKKKEAGGWVEGLLVDMPVRAIIECNGKEGVTALAVSGLENDVTFKKYSALFDSKW